MDVLEKNKQVRGGLWFSDYCCWGVLWFVYFLLKLPLTCVCVCVCALNRFSQVWLFGILWTVASQASLSMGFSWWECWRGLPFPTPEGLPDSRIEPVSLTSPTLAGRFFTTRATWEVQAISYRHSDVNARWSPRSYDTRASQECGLREQTGRCYGMNFFPCYWEKKLSRKNGYKLWRMPFWKQSLGIHYDSLKLFQFSSENIFS